MPAGIELDGFDDLSRKLEQAPQIVTEEVERAADAGLKILSADLATYPPPPPLSRYRRTGTLGRLWTSAPPVFRPMSSGFEASIGNNAPYAGYVQGTKGEDDPYQAWMHVGRWDTTQEVVDKDKARVQQQFNLAAENIAERLS